MTLRSILLGLAGAFTVSVSACASPQFPVTMANGALPPWAASVGVQPLAPRFPSTLSAAPVAGGGEGVLLAQSDGSVVGGRIGAARRRPLPTRLPPEAEQPAPPREPSPRPRYDGSVANGRTGPLDDAPLRRETAPVTSQPLAPPVQLADPVLAPLAPLPTRPAVEAATLPPVGTAPATPTPAPAPAPVPEISAPPTSVAPESAPVVQTSAPQPSAPEPTVAVRPQLTLPSGEQTVVIAPGETIFDIAERFRTPIIAVIQANDLEAPYELEPGQRLRIPPPLRYTTRPGDTLNGMARRFSIDPRSLATLNGFKVDTPVQPGQVINLPPAVRDGGIRAEATGVTPIPQGYAFNTPQATPAPAPTTRPSSPPSRSTATAAASPPIVRPPSPPPVRSATPPTPAQVASAGKGRFIWPLKGAILSGFGPKGTGQRNDGMNIAATPGASVRAAAAGEVVYAGDQVPGFGNLVLVKHPQGWVTAYAHLEKTLVKNRQTVVQGQEVGQAGSSGGVGQTQLHFEIRYAPTPNDKARPVNPEPLLP
jgi:murein DD-endopeptidase MepM/ murein hydrolase activator NlpD